MEVWSEAHCPSPFARFFHITLETAEDGWMVAECPALPGFVSQGRDGKEAIENVKEAIIAWLWAESQKAVSGCADKKGWVLWTRPGWGQDIQA